MPGDFSFDPTYQDYTSYFSGLDPSSFSDSSHPEYGTQLTQDQWSALAPSDQWGRIGGQLNLAPSDPRYAGLYPQVASDGSDPNQDILLRYGSPYDASNFVDPSKVLTGDNLSAYLHSNETPGTERGESGNSNWWQVPLEGLGILGAEIGTLGAATPFFGAAGAADAGAAAGLAGAEDVGLSTAYPFGADAATGAFDVGGSTGFGGITPLDVGTGAIDGGGAGGVTALDAAGGDTGAFDVGGSTGFGGTTPLDAGGGVSIPGVTDFDFDLPSAIPGGDVSIYGSPEVPALADVPTVNVPTPTINSAGGSLFDQGLDYVTEHPFKTAGAGLSVASLIAQSRAGKGIPAELTAAAKPISDEAAALLGQYGKGQLNPEDEWGINKWLSDQTARIKSYYASAGQGNSTAALNAVAQAESQAQAMRDKALTGLLTEGLNASGMALGPLTTAIEEEGRNDAAFQAAQANALRALFQLFGSTGGG